jgi:hypothetical protein
MNNRHDWTVAGVAFIASMLVNGMLLAYSYGKTEQRISILERERAEERAAWKEARTRIEAAIESMKQRQ